MNRFIVLLSIFLLSSCQNESENIQNESLFSLLDAEETGIHFSNDLTESADFNILEYLYFYNGGGVAIGDVNNDSLPDIFFTANQKTNKLYLNNGALAFTDATEIANVAGNGTWSTGVTMADVNGDGFLDIYVCYVSGYKGTTGHNELYINDGTGVFSEQSKVYNLDFRGFGTQAVFFDYDRDSDLDVYLLNHSVHSVNSYGKAQLRESKDERSGDRLLQSQVAQGSKDFIDVTEESGIWSSFIGYGLGVSTADVNGDGWTDIYVSNDFHENDYLYINNQDGTFTESLETQLGHSSRYSMGSDIADVNNDGLLDIFTTDMLPSDPNILLKSGGEDKVEVNEIKLKYGYGHQLARNALQLNRGNGFFSDVALSNGLFATDWSWAPLLADFDNDGFKDLFISNGIVKRPNDLDYIQYISNLSDYRHQNKNQDSIETEMIKRMPDLKIQNAVYRNVNGNSWVDVAKEWGLDQDSYSNGSAYADLDNDGDLDLVVNNINSEAFIYENHTETGGNNHLKISLAGDEYNSHSVGAVVNLKVAGQILTQQVSTVRGFQSATCIPLTFGLGQIDNIDSLEIIWPDGKLEFFLNVKPNQWLFLNQGQGESSVQRTPASPLFTKQAALIEADHSENTFNDLNQVYLLPYKLSSEGPALDVGDVNGDGLQDIFMGGSHGSSAAIYSLTTDGTYQMSDNNTWVSSSPAEDVTAKFFDADNDSDLDLIVGSGGHQYEVGHVLLKDRLYTNEGGQLTLNENFPDLRQNTTCIAIDDFDQDGDLDIMMGYDGESGNYALGGGGALLVNNGQGEFENKTEELIPELGNIGMVKGSVWADYDSDGDKDLIVAGHWMPITVFVNNSNSFKQVNRIDNSSGFWNCVSAVDIDKDGDIDLVGGNIGTNNKFSASQDKPLKMFTSDFDQNGSQESLIFHNVQDRYIPLFTKDEIEKQLVSIKKKYTTYQDFAVQVNGISSLFDDYSSAKELRIEELRSVIFFNDSANFSIKPLPEEMQYSTINKIEFYDLNNDDWLDLITAGNNLNMHIGLGRYDADYGSVALSKEGKRFQYINNDKSGLGIVGQVSNFERVSIAGRDYFIFGMNSDSIQVYKFEKYEK